MTNAEKVKIVERYEVGGIPESSITRLMKELNLNKEKFHKFMRGQTCLLIGEEVVYYTHDVIRFVEGLPVID